MDILTKKEQILMLRAKCFSISEISQILCYTITEVCEVLYEQNNRDKQGNNVDLLTLQNIKDMFYVDLSLGAVKSGGLEEYLREGYQHVYDNNLNFIGYGRKDGQ